jgi:predicted nucleic acid-binding protein
MNVYFDTCALNRLTDDPVQPRIHAEAEAVLEIIRLISEGLVKWSASEILAAEISRNPNEEKREETSALLQHAGPLAPVSALALARSRELVVLGYGAMDALHLASAEQAAVDVLLTTDDRLLRAAERGVGKPAVGVRNPIDWLQEAQTWLRPRN